MDVDRQLDASGDYQRFQGSLRRLLNLGIVAAGRDAPYPFVDDRRAGSPIGRVLSENIIEPQCLG